MKRIFSIIVLAIIINSFSFFAGPGQALAFSVNPVGLLHQVTNTVISRVSDIIYYLIMQKKYIFDDYQDPNTYVALNIPPAVSNIIASSSVLTSTSTEIKTPGTSTDLLPVGTGTIPSVKKPSLPKAPVAGQTITPVQTPVIKSNIISAPATVITPDYTNNSDIIKYTNKERAKESLAPLLANSTLDIIAGKRADDLFTNQYFEHESPDGQSASDLAKQTGYDYLLIGENLAMGSFSDEEEIVTAWMDSPGHRANILNDKYQEIGVSLKTGLFNGEKTLMAVQIFGLPLGICPKPSSATKTQIDSSSQAIKQMQADAGVMYNDLNNLKNNPQIDKAYYYQKIQEYNYFAKQVNDAILALKNMIDNYNFEVSQYNSCINL